MAYSKKTRITRKTLLIGLLLAVLLVGGGVLAYQQVRSDDPKSTTGDSDTSQGDDEINLDPPTETEKKETEQHKDDLAKQNEQPGGNTAVTPTIIDAAQYGQTIEVRASVSGVYEAGGTCTATFTQGGRTVTKQTAGFKDATTTACTPFNIPRSDFPADGDWNLVLTYTSTAAKGTSASKTVRIQ